MYDYEIGDKFVAIEIEHNRRLRNGMPCTVTKVLEGCLHAVDTDGNKRNFNFVEFGFQRAEGEEE